MQIFLENPAYIWLCIGLLLMIFEIMAPGVFLLWFGLAALGTATIQFFMPTSFSMQLLIFAINAAIWVVIGRKFYRKLGDEAQDNHGSLNERAKRYEGQIVTVTKAIQSGQGRVHVADSSWICYCDIDVPKDAKVRIIGTKGTGLIVEPI